MSVTQNGAKHCYDPWNCLRFPGILCPWRSGYHDNDVIPFSMSCSKFIDYRGSKDDKTGIMHNAHAQDICIHNCLLEIRGQNKIRQGYRQIAF